MNPKLTNKELMKELRNRTLMKIDDIQVVLVAFADIVKECLMHGVDVPFCDVGKFKYTVYTPMKDVDVYNRYTKEWTRHEYTEGFYSPRFKYYKKFKDAMGDATRITWEEMYGDASEGE